MGRIGPLPSQKSLYKIVCTVVCGGAGWVQTSFVPYGIVFSGRTDPGLVSLRQLGCPLSCHSSVLSVGRGSQCSLDHNAEGTGTWRF